MKKLRKICANEIELVKKLLSTINDNIDNYQLSKYVFDLNDGNMGSFCFKIPEEIKNYQSEEIVSYDFIDTDGVSVIITLYKYIDTNILKEVDIWKVNFEPLISFPDI